MLVVVGPTELEEVALDPLTSLAMTSLPTHARAITSCPYVVRTVTVGPITLGSGGRETFGPCCGGSDYNWGHGQHYIGPDYMPCKGTTRNGVVWILASEPPLFVPTCWQ